MQYAAAPITTGCAIRQCIATTTQPPLLFQELVDFFLLFFEAFQDLAVFLFGAAVNLEVYLGAKIRSAAFQFLPHHQKRQEQKLNHVGDKKPKDKCGKWVEPEPDWPESVPEKPENCPGQKQEKKPERPDLLVNPDGKPIQLRKFLGIQLGDFFIQLIAYLYSSIAR